MLLELPLGVNVPSVAHGDEKLSRKHCDFNETVSGIMIADELVETVKVVVESRVPVQRFVQHKQGPRVDPHCRVMGRECHHVRERGGMVDWDDAEDAEVREDLVGSLE